MEVGHTVGWPFAPDDALLVEDSLISLAALAWHQALTVPVGASVPLGFVLIGPDHAVVRSEPVGRFVERLSASRWRVGEGQLIEIDEAGLPILDDQRIRPLELD
jgi:hypothetical protein